MKAAFAMVQAVTERDDLRHFNEFMASWPVQVAFIVLYAGVAYLAFTRVLRDFGDGPARRRGRAVVVALGVFVGLEIILGGSLMGLAVLPFWFQFVVFLWLAGLLLYYLVRLLTMQRSGAGDDEARRRGAALEGVIAPMQDDLHGPAESR